MLARLTTGLEVTGAVCVCAGTYILAGLGAALLIGGALMFAASFFLSRGGSA